MFVFAPSSIYNPQYLREPQVYFSQAKPVSPRDRYLAALAEAQSAEAEYVAVLAREKAIQKQREEQHRKVELQRQREAAIRRQEEALYSQDSAPYYASHPLFSSTYRQHSRLNPFDSEAEAEAVLFHELGLRRAIARRQQQEELVNRRRLAILRQQQAEREQALTLAVARRAQEMKRREQQAELSRHFSEEEDLQQMMSRLFGERPTVIRKQPSQEKLVRFVRRSLTAPPADSYQVHPQANPAARRQSCGSHCAPRRQTVSNEQDDLERFLKLIFSGQHEAASHCPCAPKEVKERVVCRCAPLLSQAVPHHCPMLKAQAQCQPAAFAQKAHAQTPAPVATASSCCGPSLKDQLQSRPNHQPESNDRDALQDLVSSIFGASAKLERKERVKKNQDAAATTTGSAGPSTSSLSLKEQLEARLYQNPRVEVHDTVRAILASLMTEKSEAARTSASASKDTESRTDATASFSSSAPTAEGKGKGKAVSFDVPTVPTSKDVVESMNAIHNIQAAFNTLSADFSFPIRLDFTPPSSAPSSPHASDSESVSTSQLAYTSTNAPVRYYEQALSALLTQLDAVESWGNDDVRKERKELVARVEATLEQVEREVQERFIHRQARERVVEEKVQVDDVPTSEVVQDVAVPTPVEELATAVVVEAVETPTAAENVSAHVEPQSADIETVLVIDSETSCSTSSDEKLADHSKDITSSVNDIAVSGSSVSVDESVALPSEPEELSLANSTVTSISADNNTLGKVEDASLSDHQSYPPTSQIPTVSSVIEETSEDAYGPGEESERVDTFLLPAAAESPIIKRPAVHDEDELVVVDKEHEEASDGENWSEVEA
jgi:hypothetical protein